MESCPITSFQFRKGMFHFLVMSRWASHNNFVRDPLCGKTDVVFVFVRHIFHRVSHLMHNALLYFGIREYRFNRIRKTGESINAGNQNILYAMVF